MVYLFLADGFEEVEALAPLDFLKRLGVNIKTVSLKDKLVTGAHNIKVESDILIKDISLDDKLEGVILPGGMPGAKNLDYSNEVQNAIDFAYNNKKVVAAICAAPFILGKKGILKNKNATCFPGFEEYLDGASVLEKGVCVDSNVVTARGAGVAWEFGAAIGSLLKSKEEADEVLRAIQWRM